MSDPFAEYVQNPDRRRLSRFIVAYTEPVTRLVRRVIPCAEASRDVVQDVFLRLAESDLTLEKIPYPRAYVLRAALNTARDHLREEKTRRRHEREAARLKATVSHPVDEENLIAREAVERLYRYIDSLPEPLRVAIHLRAVDGLSYREIALVTDVSVGIVGSRIQEARRKLEKLSGGRELAVTWAHLELAREQGWFPAATDGLSSAALARLRKVVKPARTMIASAAIVTFVVVAALGVSVPRLMEEPPDASRPSEVSTGSGERRGGQVSSEVPSVATSERPGKPLAPVVAGAETEDSEAGGVEPESERPGKSPARESHAGQTMNGKKTLLAATALAVGMAAAVCGACAAQEDGEAIQDGDRSGRGRRSRVAGAAARRSGLIQPQRRIQHRYADKRQPEKPYRSRSAPRSTIPGSGRTIAQSTRFPKVNRVLCREHLEAFRRGRGAKAIVETDDLGLSRETSRCKLEGVSRSTRVSLKVADRLSLNFVGWLDDRGGCKDTAESSTRGCVDGLWEWCLLGTSLLLQSGNSFDDR